MNQFPECSVIMSAYNAEQTISEAVQSILDQTLENFEFIIVDDASTDSTYSILERFAGEDARIILLRNETNRERSYSRNRAVAAARTELIAVMDADDISYPSRLERQVAFMRDNPDVCVMGTYFSFVNEEGIGSPPCSDAEIRVRMLFSSPICHPSTMIRKKSMLQVGLYDENKSYAEDYDLWERLSHLDHMRMITLDEPLVAYRRYPDGKPVSKLNKYHAVKKYIDRIFHIFSVIKKQKRKVDYSLQVRMNALRYSNVQYSKRNQYIHWLAVQVMPISESQSTEIKEWFSHIRATQNKHSEDLIDSYLNWFISCLDERVGKFKELSFWEKIYSQYILPIVYEWRYLLR